MKALEIAAHKRLGSWERLIVSTHMNYSTPFIWSLILYNQFRKAFLSYSKSIFNASCRKLYMYVYLVTHILARHSKILWQVPYNVLGTFHQGLHLIKVKMLRLVTSVWKILSPINAFINNKLGFYIHALYRNNENLRIDTGVCGLWCPAQSSHSRVRCASTCALSTRSDSRVVKCWKRNTAGWCPLS